MKQSNWKGAEGLDGEVERMSVLLHKLYVRDTNWVYLNVILLREGRTRVQGAITFWNVYVADLIEGM